ncbi:Retrovirus-related Pol polyprotein from transposon RE1 [Bienertia sinuspersici]
MMKYKLESLKVIKEFMNQVNTQYGKQVRIVRIDNALELIYGPSQVYFREKGIIHQTSYVDRPHQNARVGRRHRNLLEMGRALRLQSGVPLMYCSECVMTATYITNRIPTLVLKGKSPYEALYGKKSMYDSMRNFGCLTFSYNPDRRRDKFQARGVPGIFLGYPANQKGYNILNLFTNQIFATRDVKFYEGIFPYKMSEE